MSSPMSSPRPSNVSWKRPLALAAGLVALGSAVYWLEYSHAPKREEQEEREKKLFALDDTQIASIRIVDGPEVVELRCADPGSKLCKPGGNGKWELVVPRKTGADDSNVNSLVSSLNNLVVEETIDLGSESGGKRAELLKQYGLSPEAHQAPDARRIEVKPASGEVRTAWFGETHPISSAIFTLSSAHDGKVFLVPNYFNSTFDHDLAYWRDKRLFSLASNRVKAFELQGSRERIEGSRKDGQWLLKSGSQEVTGDIENVDGLVSAATYLSAQSFAADDKASPEAKRALASARQVLSLSLRGEKGANEKDEPVTLALFETPAGKPGSPKKLYATVSNLDPLFELEDSARVRLDKALKELRLAKLITTMDRFGAKRIEFAGPAVGGQPLVLVQKEGKWSQDGEKRELSNDKVQALLDKLSGNRIQDFVDASKAPAPGSSALKLTLSDDTNAKKRELAFWKQGDKLYARDLQSSRAEVFVLDPAVAGSLPTARDHFVRTEAEKADQALKAEAEKLSGGGHDGHDHGGHDEHGHDEYEE